MLARDSASLPTVGEIAFEVVLTGGLSSSILPEPCSPRSPLTGFLLPLPAALQLRGPR